MPVIDLRQSCKDMRNVLHYLDSNMFTKDESEPDKTRILALHKSDEAQFVVPKSVKVEVEHPNTPEPAKAKIDGMLNTYPVHPSEMEERMKAQVYAILIGNATNLTKHVADANHVLEAGIHRGYFITVEGRINDRREELYKACGVKVLYPSEWLAMWDAQALR